MSYPAQAERLVNMIRYLLYSLEQTAKALSSSWNQIKFHVLRGVLLSPHCNSDISRPFHIPHLQYLIYSKHCQHTQRKRGTAVDRFSTMQQFIRDVAMSVLLYGCTNRIWQSEHRKIYIGTTQYACCFK